MWGDEVMFTISRNNKILWLDNIDEEIRQAESHFFAIHDKKVTHWTNSSNEDVYKTLYSYSSIHLSLHLTVGGVTTVNFGCARAKSIPGLIL